MLCETLAYDNVKGYYNSNRQEVSIVRVLKDTPKTLFRIELQPVSIVSNGEWAQKGVIFPLAWNDEDCSPSCYDVEGMSVPPGTRSYRVEFLDDSNSFFEFTVPIPNPSIFSKWQLLSASGFIGNYTSSFEAHCFDGIFVKVIHYRGNKDAFLPRYRSLILSIDLVTGECVFPREFWEKHRGIHGERALLNSPAEHTLEHNPETASWKVSFPTDCDEDDSEWHIKIQFPR